MKIFDLIFVAILISLINGRSIKFKSKTGFVDSDNMSSVIIIGANFVSAGIWAKFIILISQLRI